MQSFHSRENADSRNFYLFSTKNKTAQSHLTSCEIKEILEGYFCWRIVEDKKVSKRRRHDVAFKALFPRQFSPIFQYINF